MSGYDFSAPRPGGEMADAADSKSAAREGVPVRVRPRAPTKRPSVARSGAVVQLETSASAVDGVWSAAPMMVSAESVRRSIT